MKYVRRDMYTSINTLLACNEISWLLSSDSLSLSLLRDFLLPSRRIGSSNRSAFPFQPLRDPLARAIRAASAKSNALLASWRTSFASSRAISSSRHFLRVALLAKWRRWECRVDDRGETIVLRNPLALCSALLLRPLLLIPSAAA